MSLPKRALLIGIDSYENVGSLKGCVDDATNMRDSLVRDDNGDLNYDCHLFTSPGGERITRRFLKNRWQNLFENFSGDILFYFSGHGAQTATGGHIVVQDGTRDDPGLSMDELLKLANQSRAREVLLILDCCYGGDLGDLPSSGLEPQAHLREGVTILAAARPKELAKMVGGKSVFTSLVLDALAGGACDVRGYVSAASVYAYVEQTLGAWDQRPLYKSHASRLSAIRRCNPPVPDPILRELAKFFTEPETLFKLDRSYEHSEPSRIQEHVEIFNKFKLYRDSRLLRTVNGEDLYYAALHCGCVELTPLGKLYRRLAKEGKF